MKFMVFRPSLSSGEAKLCKHQNDQRKANAPVHSQHQHKAGNRRDLSAHQIRQLMGKVSLHLGAVFINDFFLAYRWDFPQKYPIGILDK